VCCDTGSRSSAGAFILSERGFDACVLKGGMNHSKL
jgi:rhodanese-related sulfurtransferase